MPNVTAEKSGKAGRMRWCLLLLLVVGCAGQARETRGDQEMERDLAASRQAERHQQEQIRLEVDASQRDWQRWYDYYRSQGYPEDEAALRARQASRIP